MSLNFLTFFSIEMAWWHQAITWTMHLSWRLQNSIKLFSASMQSQYVSPWHGIASQRKLDYAMKSEHSSETWRLILLSNLWMSLLLRFNLKNYCKASSIVIHTVCGTIYMPCKPKPKPLLTFHLWGFVAFTSSTISQWERMLEVENFLNENHAFEIFATSARGQWVSWPHRRLAGENQTAAMLL